MRPNLKGGAAIAAAVGVLFGLIGSGLTTSAQAQYLGTAAFFGVLGGPQSPTPAQVSYREMSASGRVARLPVFHLAPCCRRERYMRETRSLSRLSLILPSPITRSRACHPKLI